MRTTVADLTVKRIAAWFSGLLVAIWWFECLPLVEGAVPSAWAATSRSTSAASTSDAARRDAMRAIPLERLSAGDRARVDAVLSNVSVFRRMPARVIDCDPRMYLFLVRHPDVVVGVWELLKISRLQLRQTDDGQFSIAEPNGAAASFKFVYQSPNVHVVYGEGTYRGPLLNNPVKGRGVLVLKTGHVRETNGRDYVTSRLDCFLNIEPTQAELLTKTVSPLMGKTADNNFLQTLAFVSSLSRTAEVNGRGVRELSTRLSRVRPEVRDQFSLLTAEVGQRPAVASRLEDRVER